jgi:phosphate starvation-inducible PhoH-like protein
MKPAKANNNTAVINQELSFSDNAKASILFGDLNKNLQILEKSAGVTINARGSSVKMSGLAHEVELAATLLNQLYDIKIGRAHV